MWLPAAEALRRLNVKPQTLYASVSRGRIRAKPDPADTRRSLYSQEDVERLARRAVGRPRTEAVAAEAISWGEAILPSALSTVSHGRLCYRGRDVAELSVAGSLEDVAALLWRATFSPAESASSGDIRECGIKAVLLALAARTATDTASYLRGPVPLRQDAGDTLAAFADALMGPGTGPLHQRLASHFGVPDSAEDLRTALVLLADHELNASTFAARVAVSTGASLAAGTLAALATLTGPLHGRASLAVKALAEDLAASDRQPIDALRDWLGEGRAVPGFGHRLYPSGDRRAATLLARLQVPAPYAQLLEAADVLLGDPPNIDFALAALAATHHLPATAPFEIFALGRSVGWLAHMLEQVETGALIRPRARYVGQTPR